MNRSHHDVVPDHFKTNIELHLTFFFPLVVIVSWFQIGKQQFKLSRLDLDDDGVLLCSSLVTANECHPARCTPCLLTRRKLQRLHTFTACYKPRKCREAAQFHSFVVPPLCSLMQNKIRQHLWISKDQREHWHFFRDQRSVELGLKQYARLKNCQN